MGLLDNTRSSGNGSSYGQSNKFNIPTPEPVDPSDWNIAPSSNSMNVGPIRQSSSQSTPWEDRGFPERVSYNAFAPSTTATGSQGQSPLETAFKAPGYAAERPLAAVNILTRGQGEKGAIDVATDIISNTPIVNWLVGRTGDLLNGNFATALSNSIVALSINLEAQNIKDAIASNDYSKVISEREYSSGRKSKATVASLMSGAKSRGFTDQDINDLINGKKGIFDFGDRSKGYVASQNAAIDMGLQIALDPTLGLSTVGKVAFQGFKNAPAVLKASEIFFNSSKVAPVLNKAADSAHAVSNAWQTGSMAVGNNAYRLTLPGYRTSIKEAITGTRIGTTAEVAGGILKGAAKSYGRALTGRVTYGGYTPSLYQKYLISSTAFTAGQGGLSVATDLITNGDEDNFFVGGLYKFINDLEEEKPLSDKYLAWNVLSAWKYPYRAVTSSTKGATIGRVRTEFRRLYSIDRALITRLSDDMPNADKAKYSARVAYVKERFGGDYAWDSLKAQVLRYAAYYGSEVHKVPGIAPALADAYKVSPGSMPSYAMHGEILSQKVDDHLARLIDNGQIPPAAVDEALDAWVGNLRGVEELTGGVQARVSGSGIIDNWVRFLPLAEKLWATGDNYGKVVLGNFDGVFAKEHWLGLRAELSAAAVDGKISASKLQKIIQDNSAILSPESAGSANTWREYLLRDADESFDTLDDIIQKELAEAPTLNELTGPWGAREAAAPVDDLVVPRGPVKSDGTPDLDWSPDATEIFVSRFRDTIRSRLKLTEELSVQEAVAARADETVAVYEQNIGKHLADHGYTVTTAKPVVGVWQRSAEPSMHIVLPFRGPKVPTDAGDLEKVLKSPREAAVIALRGGTSVLNDQQDAVLLVLSNTAREAAGVAPNYHRMSFSIGRAMSFEESQKIVDAIADSYGPIGSTIDREAGTIQIMAKIDDLSGAKAKSSSLVLAKAISEINGGAAPTKKVEGVYAELIVNDLKGEAVSYLGKAEVTVSGIEQAARTGAINGDARFYRAVGDSAELRPAGVVADGPGATGLAGADDAVFRGTAGDLDRPFSPSNLSSVTKKLSQETPGTPEYQALQDEALDELSRVVTPAEKQRVLGALGADISRLQKTTESARIRAAEEMAEQQAARVGEFSRGVKQAFNTTDEEANALAELWDAAMRSEAAVTGRTVKDVYDSVLYGVMRGGDVNPDALFAKESGVLADKFARAKTPADLERAIQSAQEFRPTDDMVALGKKLGDERLSTYHPVEVIPGTSLNPGATDIALPGGLEFLANPAPYSLADEVVIRSQAIVPEMLPDQIRFQLYSKLWAGKTVDFSDPVDLVNRISFALTSANKTALPINEAQYMVIRARDLDDVGQMASFVRKARERGVSDKDMGRELMRHYRMYLPESEISKYPTAPGADPRFRQETLRGLVGPDGYFPNPDIRIGSTNQTQAYQRIALISEFADSNPSWFTIRAGETAENLADRLLMIKGIGVKVGNFAVELGQPMTLNRGTIDLQMSLDLFRAAEKRGDLSGLVERLSAVPGGKTYADTMVKALRGEAETINAPFRSLGVKAKMSDELERAYSEIPESIRTSRKDIPVYEGSPVQIMDDYLGVLQAADAATVPGLANVGRGAYQWFRWDAFRGKVEPHSLLYKNANKLPRAEFDDVQKGLDTLRAAGFTRPTDAVQAFNPNLLAKYFKKDGAKVVGSTEFLENGRALIKGFEGSNWTTATHEFAHVFRGTLLKGAALEAASKWAGATLDDAGRYVWTRAQEEKFADAFNVWLKKGKAPTKSLVPVFEKFRQWLLGLYDRVRGKKLSPEVESAFESLFRQGDEVVISPRNKDQESLLNILSRMEDDLKGSAGQKDEALANVAKDAEVEKLVPMPRWHPSMKGVDQDLQLQLAPLGADVLAKGKYTLSEAPSLAIPTAPGQGYIAQVTQTRTGLYDSMIIDNPIVSGPLRFIDWLTKPVAAGKNSNTARQFLYRELLSKGATVAEVNGFLALLKESVDEAVFMGLPVYKTVGAVWPSVINSKAKLAFKADVVKKVGEGNFWQLVDRAQSRYYRYLDTQAGVPGSKGFVTRALKDVYESYQPSRVSQSARAVSRFAYPFFRFMLDPRWWAMNKFEADVINGTKYGLQATRVRGANTALEDAAYATHRQRGLPVMGAEIDGIPTSALAGLDAGFSDMRRLTGYGTRALEVARQRNGATLLREFGVNPGTGEFEAVEQAINFIGQRDPIIRRLGQATPEQMFERAEKLRQRLVALQKQQQGKPLSQILDEELYAWDKKGHRAGMEGMADDILAENKREMSPLLQRLYELNEASYASHISVLRGNTSRSNLERILNSYWLYWPFSYQLKATRWLYNVLTDAAGEGTLKNVVRLERLREIHMDQFENNSEYAAVFENNPSLWRTAQMLLPITPGDIGVTLSRGPRYLGGALGVFPEYASQDPITMAGRMMVLGPSYTLELLSQTGREGTFDVLPFVGD